MTIDEWKVKLKPAGVLLILYFAAPLIIGWILGSHDMLFGGFSVSNIIQAGLGGYILHKLFGLKETLSGELTAKLSKFGQPQEKVLELSGKISSAAVFISIAGLLLPPLSGMFPDSRLMTLGKFSILGYIIYLVCGIWKLYEPFLTYVPPAEPEAAPNVPRNILNKPLEVTARRCVKCGQRMDDSMKICAFCRQPVQ